jgi:hypothetical protein
MPFDARQFLSFFGVDGIKQARKGNLMAHCPDFEGLHPNGDKKRSFGILEEPKWDSNKAQWIPAGTANCYVCGGMSLEMLTARLLGRSMDREVNELEAYSWLESKDWLPEGTDDLEVPQLLDFLSGLSFDGDMDGLETFDDKVLDPYLKALHPQALQRGETPNAISVEVARDIFKLGYCERSKRTVVPVFTATGRVFGVVSRATKKDDFIRYGVGVPDESFPNPGWKMKLDFLKSQVLYGEWLWNRFKNNTLLVIESPLDVAYAYQMGLFEQMDVGAIFGAKPSKEQLRKIAEYEYVIEGLDQDNAGREGAEYMMEHLKGTGCKLFEFDSYFNKDLGDCTPEQVQNITQRFRPYTPKAVFEE